jgi:hypothetical protein
MATVTRTGAIYGIGVFGQDLYGVSNVSIIPVGVAATTAIGTVTVTAGAVVLPTGVQVVANVGNVVITVTAFPAGVEAVTAIGTVSVFNNALPNFTGVQASLLIGPVSVVTTSFDYNAVKEQYDRRRTILILRKSSSQDRVVYIPTEPRQSYVRRRSNTFDRTKLAA